MLKRTALMIAACVLVPAPGMGADAVCSCKANGQTYELGEIACFTLPNGQKRARCDRVLNNTSWTFLDGECPSASAGEDKRFAAMCLPADSAAGNSGTILNARGSVKRTL